MKCFEEDEESCLPKSAEVLVVIENMTMIIIKLVRVYIYIVQVVLKLSESCLCLTRTFEPC